MYINLILCEYVHVNVVPAVILLTVMSLYRQSPTYCVCMCVYVCVYAYIKYVYIFVCVYIYIYIYIVYMHINMCKCMLTLPFFPNMFTDTHIDDYAYIHIHTHTYIQPTFSMTLYWVLQTTKSSSNYVLLSGLQSSMKAWNLLIRTITQLCASFGPSIISILVWGLGTFFLGPSNNQTLCGPARTSHD
jgi:hypothetical protein